MGCGASSGGESTVTVGGSSREASLPQKAARGRKGDMNFSVLVIGGTGLLGREFVRQALQKQWRVRVAVRNKKTDMCRILAAMGAEIVHVEEKNRGSMVAAASMQDAAVLIPPTFQTTTDQTEMWIDALAVAATVGRVVAVTSVYNFPNDSALGRFRQTVRKALEKNTPLFQKGWAEVRCSLTMQGWMKHWIPSIVKNKVHAHPFQDVKFAWIDASDVATVISILVLPFQRNHGQTISLRGKTSISHFEAVQLVSHALQRPSDVKDISGEEWAEIFGRVTTAEGAAEFVEYCIQNMDDCAALDTGEYAAQTTEELRPFSTFVSQMIRPAMLSQDVRSFI